MNASFFNQFIYIALLLLLVLTPLPYGTVEIWSTTLWELLVCALTLFWAGDVVQTGRLMLARNPLALPLVGLLLLAGAQLLPLSAGRPLTYDAYATWQAAVKILASLLFFLLFATFVNTDERRRTAAKVVIGVCTLIALIAIGQTYTGKVLWPRAALGPFVNRNHFAGFLELGIGLAGGLLVGRGTRREWLAVYASALLVLCAGLVLSASRGGFLALGAELIFLIVIAAPGWNRAQGGEKSRAGLLLRVVAALLLGAGAMAGAVWLVGSEGLVANFSQLEKETQQESLDRYSRRDIWQASWEIIKAHPIAGVGLGAFQFAYTRYDRSSGAQRVEQAHNDYLQVLADGGVLGGVLALTFLELLFLHGFLQANSRDQRRRAVVLGALAGCFAIAVHSFVDFNLQVTANAQSFLALCALATTPLERGSQRRD
ncbi:MAG: O-antigen ligase family protein [Acidobacteria bacterium]|nr:O-antigen ligase family protein [Acidobacteriota bacterium]MBI3427518.1 O-antigen ligase family protein [Acidobacteriota bacterium]